MRIPIHIFNLSRRRVRYWCFRFRKNELDGLKKLNVAPLGLKEHFEKMIGFPGWNEFAVSWDIPHLKNCNHRGKPPIGTSCSCSRHVVPLKIVGRDKSVWDEWKMTIRKDAPVLKIEGKHKVNQAKAISKGS